MTQAATSPATEDWATRLKSRPFVICALLVFSVAAGVGSAVDIPKKVHDFWALFGPSKSVADAQQGPNPQLQMGSGSAVTGGISVNATKAAGDTTVGNGGYIHKGDNSGFTNPGTINGGTIIVNPLKSGGGASPAALTIGVNPDTVEMSAGSYRAIKYQFEESGDTRVTIESQDARFVLHDGTELFKQVGGRILGTSFVMKANSKYTFIDNVYLPPDIVQKVRALKKDNVQLETVFLGVDAEGRQVKARAMLRIYVKPGVGEEAATGPSSAKVVAGDVRVNNESDIKLSDASPGPTPNPKKT